MPAISTSQTAFGPNEQLTSAKLNNILLQSQMASGAVTLDGTLTVVAGQLQVGVLKATNFAAGGIATVALADNAVTTLKILDANVTTAKIAPLNVTAGLLATDAVETAKIKNANVTAAKLSGAQSGTAPVYGVRAWVRFNGNKNEAGTLDPSNTPRQILGSGNIASVTKNATGDYSVSIAANMPSVNYAAIGQRAYESGNSSNITIQANPLTPQTVSTFRLLALSSAGAATDSSDIQIMFIG